MIFLVAILVFAHLGLVLGGRLYQDDFNQFHDFEHWPGQVLVFLRIALWGASLTCLCVVTSAGTGSC